MTSGKRRREGSDIVNVPAVVYISVVNGISDASLLVAGVKVSAASRISAVLVTESSVFRANAT